MKMRWNMRPDSISAGHEHKEEPAADVLPTDAEEQEEDEPVNVSLFIMIIYQLFKFWSKESGNLGILFP